MKNKKIAFGGGCHWCTEAIFQSIIGVQQVEQGWVSSKPPHDALSEGVIVHFDSGVIDLKSLIEIHLATHSSTSNHLLRYKYRSAIYYFVEEDKDLIERFYNEIRKETKKQYVTSILPLVEFKLNTDTYLNYYQRNPEKAFCKTYIDPKLKKLRRIKPYNVKEIF